jgi:hypothetical protein
MFLCLAISMYQIWSIYESNFTNTQCLIRSYSVNTIFKKDASNDVYEMLYVLKIDYTISMNDSIGNSEIIGYFTTQPALETFINNNVMNQNIISCRYNKKYPNMSITISDTNNYEASLKIIYTIFMQLSIGFSILSISFYILLLRVERELNRDDSDSDDDDGNNNNNNNSNNYDYKVCLIPPQQQKLPCIIMGNHKHQSQSYFQKLLPGPEDISFYNGPYPTHSQEPYYKCANIYCHFIITERGVEERTKNGAMIRDTLTQQPYCTNCTGEILRKSRFTDAI